MCDDDDDDGDDERYGQNVTYAARGLCIVPVNMAECNGSLSELMGQRALIASV